MEREGRDYYGQDPSYMLILFIIWIILTCIQNVSPTKDGFR